MRSKKPLADRHLSWCFALALACFFWTPSAWLLYEDKSAFPLLQKGVRYAGRCGDKDLLAPRAFFSSNTPTFRSPFPTARSPETYVARRIACVFACPKPKQSGHVWSVWPYPWMVGKLLKSAARRTDEPKGSRDVLKYNLNPKRWCLCRCQQVFFRN